MIKGYIGLSVQMIVKFLPYDRALAKFPTGWSRFSLPDDRVREGKFSTPYQMIAFEH